VRCDAISEISQRQCSLEQGHRGIHIFGDVTPMLNPKKRPTRDETVVIVDDPFRETKQTPAQREALKKWVSETFPSRAREEVDKCGDNVSADNGETYACQLDEGHEPPCSALSKEHTRLARATLTVRLTGILSHAWANAVMAEPDRWSPEEVDEATEVVRLLLKKANPELIAEAHALLKVSRKK
jgi:hypothetical protein